jgi:hypothetical protein
MVGPYAAAREHLFLDRGSTDPHGPTVTALFLENSELSPVTMFVAVALTVCPGTCRSSGRELRHEKRAFPLALVEASTVFRRLFHARIPHQRMP